MPSVGQCSGDDSEKEKNDEEREEVGEGTGGRHDVDDDSSENLSVTKIGLHVSGGEGEQGRRGRK